MSHRPATPASFDLTWQPEPLLKLKPGDFNLHIDLTTRTVLVPKELFQRFDDLGWNFVRFVSQIIQAERPALAKYLGWSPEDLQAARSILIAKLTGVVDPYWLAQQPARGHATGALVRTTDED